MDDREPYGRLVRETWVAWALKQPGAKPSWTVPWEDLDGGQREVDMRIGESVAAAERERIRQMAIERGAVYCQRGVCTCIRLGSSPTIASFAGLIGAGEEAGRG